MLGPLEVRDGEEALSLGGFRQRLVLAVLVLYAGRPLSIDWLIDAVWGEEPPRTARKTLQVYVSRLRRLLGPASIEAGSAGYQLQVAPCDIDARRFEDLEAEGRRLLPSDPRAAAETLRAALSLWRGMPWGELGDEPAIQPEAQRLRELRLAAIGDRIAADLESGLAPALVGELEGLVEEYPLREGFRSQLMLALYRSGRQADALRIYQATRRLLGEELGIEPSPDLRDLEEKILLQDPSIEGPAVPDRGPDWALARNPYKGLSSFREEDAEDFFGRADLVAGLSDRIHSRSLVAAVGASGSGKSSAVMAGLVPRLRAGSSTAGEGWVVATMVPGRSPFAEFVAAMRRVMPEDATRLPAMRGDEFDILRAAEVAVSDENARVLLVIDQFEEVFHEAIDAGERQRFVRNLVEAVEDPHSQLTVLVTLRGDFFDEALKEQPLGGLISDGLASVLPLTAAQLEAAAVRPAERVGMRLEPELVAELVADMTDQPGALPLFQYVLTEIFERRTGPILTRATYRGLGGLRGALSRRAEQTYLALDAA